MRGTYGRKTLEKAQRLFEAGYGFKGAATALGIPASTVREWHAGWRALGEEWIDGADVKRDYPAQLKLDCARACVDGGESVVEAMRRFGVGSRLAVKRWKAAYREGGAAAFSSGEGIA